MKNNDILEEKMRNIYGIQKAHVASTEELTIEMYTYSSEENHRFGQFFGTQTRENTEKNPVFALIWQLTGESDRKRWGREQQNHEDFSFFRGRNPR